MSNCKFFVLGALLFLVGCGPIIGAGMVAGGGVKDFEVVEGRLDDIQPGSNVLIVGPFAKTESAYYICRGEEAANFTSAFNSIGLFHADFHMQERFGDPENTAAKLKQMTAEQLQKEFGLKKRPELLLTGVILKRSTVAAPANGVLMDVGYRLEFYDLEQNKQTSIRVRVKDLFQDCIVDVAEALAAEVTGR